MILEKTMFYVSKNVRGFLVLQIILGPLFIVGTVGISMFGSSAIGFLLLVTHILACLTVGFIFRFWKSSRSKKEYIEKSNYNSSNISFNNLGDVLASSISKATSTILMIGGFVVMFSVIVSILNQSHFISIVSKFLMPFFNVLHIPNVFISPVFTGILEITNGISAIANIHIKTISINIILASFLLGIGGISILLQVLSITSKTDLSIKPYIIGKILQSFFAAFYTWVFMQLFPMFNFNL